MRVLHPLQNLLNREYANLTLLVETAKFYTKKEDEAVLFIKLRIKMSKMTLGIYTPNIYWIMPLHDPSSCHREYPPQRVRPR